MSYIGYIAPNKKMADIAKEVFREHDISVRIEVGSLEKGLKKAEKLVKEGVLVLISRGGTALFIRERLNIPIVDIPIAASDIANSIIKASTLGNKITIIGFYNLTQGIESFNPLLNVDLKQVYITNEDEAFSEILKAKREGTDVIIGGAIQHRISKEVGLKSVFLETGPLGIYQAYREAEVLLNTILKEKQNSEEIRAIFNYARDGFLAINKESNVTLINSAAAKAIECTINEVLGKPIDKVAPMLSDLTEVLKDGTERINDIKNIGRMNIIYNRVPITVNDAVVGAVVIFQDTDVLQESESRIRREIYTKGLYAKYTFENIDGSSQIIDNTKFLARKFSLTNSTVLINGETGTGKEIFAQSIHNASYRSNGPFVAVNCASLPVNILESELFGYVEGAFTGALKKGKPGLFELAHKGTILLDEISEIPLMLQGRLLRVLQEKNVMRLGDDKLIPIDVRIIATTNKDLVDAVRKGEFREDLFFRLNILRLDLPPLRDRLEDIELLTLRFLKEYDKNEESYTVSKSALEILKKHKWPGNIRELRNLIERISVISTSNMISEDIVRTYIDETNRILYNDLDYDKAKNEEGLNSGLIREKPTKEQICEALKITNYNKTKAAMILGVNRSTLWRWLKDI